MMRTRSQRRLVTVAVLAVITTLLAGHAPAQVLGPGVAPPRPIRIEGSFGATQADKEVIGEIMVGDGTPRRFGVTELQAYKPEEEGISVLRHSALQPITLRLQGDEKLVRKFMSAPDDAKVVAFGVYRPGTGNCVLMSVEIVDKYREAARGDDDD
jgi:hypothetical protein